MLADRGFCSFASLATLLAHGVDAVMRVHHFRKRDWRAGRRLGWRDRLVRWVKGPFQGQFWTRAVGAVAGSDHRAPGGNSGGGAGLPHPAAGGGHDAVGRANLWRGGVGPFIFSPLGGGVVFSRHQNHAGPGCAALSDAGHGAEGNRDARAGLQPELRRYSDDRNAVIDRRTAEAERLPVE